MIFRRYPIIISKLETPNDYLAIAPDLELATAIHGFEDIKDVCGGAMSVVHQLVSAMKQDKVPLPPATTMEDAETFMHNEVKNAIMLISVVVAQSEDGDGCEGTDT